MVMALGLLFGLFLGGAYAIGFGQVALGGRGVLGAVAHSPAQLDIDLRWIEESGQRLDAARTACAGRPSNGARALCGS